MSTSKLDILHSSRYNDAIQNVVWNQEEATYTFCFYYIHSEIIIFRIDQYIQHLLLSL
jgi:hypothetical protein